MQKQRLGVFSLIKPENGYGGAKFLLETIKSLSGDYELFSISAKEEIQDKDIKDLRLFVSKHLLIGSKDTSRIQRFFSPLPRSVAVLDIDRSRIQIFLEKNKIDQILFLDVFSTLFVDLTFWSQKSCLVSTNIEYKLPYAQKNSSFLSKVKAIRESYKIKKIERITYKNFDRIAFLTDKDKVQAKLVFDADSVILPPLISKKDYKAKIKNYSLITTNLKYGPNRDSIIWFVDNVLPYLKSKVVVTGKDSNNYLSNLSKDRKIEYPGFVSTMKLQEYFQNAKNIINPTISGSGFQIKLIEALAYGKIVITTKASNPIDGAAYVANDAKDMAELINSSLKELPFNYDDFYQDNKKKWLKFINEK